MTGIEDVEEWQGEYIANGGRNRNETQSLTELMIVEGLARNTTYFFRARARTTRGWTPFSPRIAFNTLTRIYNYY